MDRAVREWFLSFGAAYRSTAAPFLLKQGKMPEYFASMLADVDRARQYEAALRACVADWRANHPGRDPVVLDLGVGTGLLTYLALQADPRVRVIAVDTNANVLGLAKALLEQHDSALVARVTFVQTAPGTVLRRRARRGGHSRQRDSRHLYQLRARAHLCRPVHGAGASGSVGPLRRPAQDRAVPRPARVPDDASDRVRGARSRDAAGGRRHALLPDRRRRPRHTARRVRESRGRLSRDPRRGVLRGGRNGRARPRRRLRPAGGGARRQGDAHPARRDLRARSRRRAALLEAARVEERRRNNALALLEWDAELWTDVWLRNTLDGYRALRAEGDPDIADRAQLGLGRLRRALHHRL